MGSLTHLEILQFLKTNISFNISPKELTTFCYSTAVNTIQITLTNIQQYCTVICTVKNLFAVQSGTCTQNCHTLPIFIDKFIDCSSWITNLLLDVLVCRITFYYIDTSVLLENTQVKFISNHIWDSSSVFSISSLVRISMLLLISSLSLKLYLNSLVYD